MDSVDGAINVVIMRIMCLPSYDLSDEQVIELFSQIRQLQCQEHGPDCISNKISSKFDEETKSSLRKKLKQFSETFKTSDSTKKSSMIDGVFNELKPLVNYVPESKCITHIVMDKSYAQFKGMGTNPMLGLWSMFSGISANMSEVPSESRATRSRFRPVYTE